MKDNEYIRLGVERQKNIKNIKNTKNIIYLKMKRLQDLQKKIKAKCSQHLKVKFLGEFALAHMSQFVLYFQQNRYYK